MCKFLLNLFSKKNQCVEPEQNETIEINACEESEPEDTDIIMQVENILHLTLDRKYKLNSYTIGKLYVEGNYFCDTLEDVDRGLTNDMPLDEIKVKKVKNETAIPCGEYEITLSVKSPKYSNYERYSWAEKYKGKIPRLLNVKGFEGVLIHVGNSADDSSGCILVGENKSVGKVLNSTITFNKLMDTVLLPNKDKKIIINIY